MRNKTNQLIKFLLLTLFITVVLTNCEKESTIQDEIENSEKFENSYNSLIKNGKLEDLTDLKNYINKLKEEKINETSRTSLEENNDFTIVDENNIYIYTDSVSTTYTLSIQKDNQNSFSFSNLIVKFTNDNPTTAFILNYTPDQNYLNTYVSNPTTPFEGTVNYEPIDYDGSLDNLNVKAGCYHITITYCNWSEGNVEGPVHIATTLCTPEFMFDVTYDLCPSTVDGESNEISITTPPGSSGGGGTTSDSTPTNPLPTDTCEDASTGNTGLVASNGECISTSWISFFDGLSPGAQSLLNNNLTVRTQIQHFLTSSYFSTENQEFANEILSIAYSDIDLDLDALGFVLEAKLQDKIYNNFDADFFNSINKYTVLNLSNQNYHDPFLINYYIKVATLRSLNPEWSDAKILWEATKDIIHIGLDIFGMVPVVGEVADLANGVLYAIEGDGINASISLAATIPLVGNGATISKYAVKIVDTGGTLASSIGSKVKLVWKVTANGVNFGSSSKLRKVLGLTDSNFQAHHIIPWAFRNNEIVQKASKSGNAFHMNESLNGIPMHTDFHNGSHPNYSNQITQYFNEFLEQNQNATPDECYNFLTDLIQDIRTAIQNNPTTHINQLIF